MFTKDNTQYRNLQEQVAKNKSDIEYLINEEGALNQFGLKVVGQADTISNVPTVVAYKESNPNWEYGDAYMVGTSSQGADTVEVDNAILLVLTRANTVYSTDFWMNLGEFPKSGPQGATGAQGEKGDKGDKGLGVIQGTGEPTGNAENGTTYIDSSNGDVYLRANSTWVLTGNIRGPQGIRGATGAQGVQGKIGPQGPQGLQGERGIGVNILGTLTSTAQLPDPTTVAKDSAYIIPDAGINHLWVIEGTDNLLWTDFGTAGLGEKGDKGDAGRGIDTLTAVDLTYGNATVTYDTTAGMTINGTTRFTYTDGNHDANMAIEVPVVAGEGIVIGKKASEEKVEVKLDTALTDGKYVPKTTTAWRVYATDNVGNPKNINYTAELGGNALIQRDSNGRAKIQTPTDAMQIANKEYVDDNFVPTRKVTSGLYLYAFDSTGNISQSADTGKTAYTIARRTAGGRLVVGDPEGQNDAVTKSYADNRFRYTHLIEVKYNPAPEPYVSYVLIGTITYVSEVSTALTSIDDLPLDVPLPINGKMYNDALRETYTVTRKTRSDGTSYLVVSYLQYDDTNGITIATHNITPTSFTDTVL